MLVYESVPKYQHLCDAIYFTHLNLDKLCDSNQIMLEKIKRKRDREKKRIL